jgi:LAS superfamily LD-carboxypeptidase LdcB
MVNSLTDISQAEIELVVMGCSDTHVSRVDNHIMLNKEVIEPWRSLCSAAADAGFELVLASGYRSFERQLVIWNDKLTGLRPVLDETGNPMDISCLSPMALAERVLRWSALPGSSRHHWGTDMDIYDRSVIDSNYSLKLTSDEYASGGPFAPMIAWLREYLLQPGSPEFFFPYSEDKGGVMPEPWHLSYRPVAERYQQLWSLPKLSALLQDSDIVGKETIIQNLNSIYKRFIEQSIYPDQLG